MVLILNSDALITNASVMHLNSDAFKRDDPTFKGLFILKKADYI